jgi:hypothetical protein
MNAYRDQLKAMSDEQLAAEMAKHARDALLVQGACNLSGVVFAYARVMDFLCELSNRPGSEIKGTDDRNGHPLARLFADKCASLSGSARHVIDAYAWAEEIGGKGDA